MSSIALIILTVFANLTISTLFHNLFGLIASSATHRECVRRERMAKWSVAQFTQQNWKQIWIRYTHMNKTCDFISNNTCNLQMQQTRVWPCLCKLHYASDNASKHKTFHGDCFRRCSIIITILIDAAIHLAKYIDNSKLARFTPGPVNSYFLRSPWTIDGIC